MSDSIDAVPASPTTPLHDRMQDLFTKTQEAPLIHPLERLRKTRSLHGHKRRAPTSSPMPLSLDTAFANSQHIMAMHGQHGHSMSASSLPTDWTTMFSPMSATIPTSQPTSLSHMSSMNVPTRMNLSIEVVAAEGVNAPFEDLTCMLKIGHEVVCGTSALCMQDKNVCRVDWNQKCELMAGAAEFLEISIHSETLALCMASGKVQLSSVPMPYAGWIHLDVATRIFLRMNVASNAMPIFATSQTSSSEYCLSPMTSDAQISPFDLDAVWSQADLASPSYTGTVSHGLNDTMLSSGQFQNDSLHISTAIYW